MNKLSLQKISEYALLFIPVALITGPLISEICIIIISIFAIYYIFHKQDYEIFKNKIVISLLIFCIILILSSLLSEFVSYSIKTSIPYIRFILFTVGTYYILNLNPKIKKNFFLVLFFSFLFLSIGGIYEFFFKKFCTGYSSQDIYEIQNNFFFCSKYLFIGNLIRPDRLSSFLGSEMVLGSYLSRLLPLLVFLAYLFVEKNKKNFFIYISFLILILLTIVLSGERTSFFFSIIFFVIIIFFYKISFKIKLVIFSFIIFIFSFLSLFNETVKKRMFIQTLNQIYLEKNKLTFFSDEHQSHAIVAYKIFTDHPIIGSGPKTFRKICPKKYSHLKGCTTHPHNLYLQLFSEVGIIGSVIPVCFLIIVIIIYFKQFLYLFLKNNDNLKFDKICIVSCFFITLFPFVPAGNIFNNWMSIIFYLPIGFYLNYIKS